MFQCITDGKINSLPVSIDVVSDSDEGETSAEEDSNSLTLGKKIQVQISGKATGVKVQKRHACVYCGALNTKLSRHLTNKHAEEVEVAKILNLKKDSVERKNAWMALTRKGNFAHNQNVKEKGYGVLITKRMPLKNRAAVNYLPCEYCLAYLDGKDMWRHHKRCISKPKDVESDNPILNAKLLLPLPCSEELYKHVVSKIRNDDLTPKIISDPLILEFGQRELNRIGKHRNTQQISQKMRMLARCLTAISKDDDSVTSLGDLISAVRWKTVIETIKKQAGFNAETEEYERPTFAIKCGRSFKKCAVIIRNKCNENGDEATREKAVRFLEMYEEEWHDLVGARARKSEASRKYNKIKLVSLVKDVINLARYIDEEINNLKNSDYSDSKEEAYVRMHKLTLAQVSLLNRKRVYEVQRLTKEEFGKASINPQVDEEVKSCLTKFEQELCGSLLQVETKRAKCGKKVTILFTSAMQENVNKLLSFHESLGSKSKYVFMPLQGSKVYSGMHVLRQMACEAELLYANRITSAAMRKQLASLFQVLCLSENNRDILAKFIGHDIRLDRQFYHSPEGIMEVAKVARLVYLMNSGNISADDGKTLDDINVDVHLGKTC